MNFSIQAFLTMRWLKQALVVAFLGGLISPAMAQINLSFSITSPTCSNYTNGMAVVTATGGTAPYQYYWSNNQSGSTTASLAGGSYTVSVTDALGVMTTGVANVTAPLELYGVIDLGDTCAPSGNILAIANGGVGPYSFAWSNGGTTAQVSQPLNHSECVTITDFNGCVDVTCSKVFKPMVTVPVTDDVDCADQFLGSIFFVLSGGYGPYQYSWSNGSTASFLSGVPAGTYTLSITDYNGCNHIATGNIVTENSTVTSTTSSTSACPLAATGSASAMGSGGVTPYSYIWSNGVTTSSNPGLSSGTYVVTTVDNIGCSGTNTVVVGQSTLIATTAVINPATCDDDNGNAQVSASGGSGPYTYAWSNGDSGFVLSEVVAGAFTVTVTDNTGCTNIATVTVPVNEQVLNLDFVVIGSTCGAANGMIEAFVTNGVAPFVYIWNNGNATDMPMDLVAGIYTVTVTGSNGCVGVESVEVPALTGSLQYDVEVIPTACIEVNSGSATIANIVGFDPYTYNWSTGGTTQTITGLGVGDYTVTVTDGSGCSGVSNFNVGVGPALELTFSNVNATCGLANGTVNVDVTGGDFPWSFLWSTGGTNQSVPFLNGGTYTVTVTDEAGCSSVASTVLDQQAAFTYALLTTPTTCNGDFDATAAVVDLQDAIEPIVYAWSDGTNGTFTTNLAAGTYTVTVSEGSGCTSISAFEIEQPNELNVTFTNVLSEACGNLGQATATIFGGNGGNTIVWSTGSTDATIIVASGTYSVTVTDDEGCSTNGAIFIDLGTDGAASISSAETQLDCNTNSILLVASEGLTYVWSNGSTNDSITVNNPGTYTVTVTVAANCTASATITITEIDNDVNVNVDNIGNGNITCTNLVVMLEVENLNPGDQVLWSTGETSDTINVLVGGVYTVTVTNSSGCTDVDSYEVDVNINTPNITTTSENITCADLAATVSAQITGGGGGGGGNSYDWSNGATGPFFNTTVPGTFTVTATNNNGCTNTAEVIVALDTIAPTAAIETPEGTLLTCVVTELMVIATSGDLYAWSSGSSNDTTMLADPGDYTVTVSNSNGCSSTATVTITLDPDAVDGIVEANLNPLNCLVAVTTINVSGGTSYLWSTGATTTSITAGVGTYTVTTSNDTGCTDVDEITISQTPNPSLDIDITSFNSQINCNFDTVTLLANSDAVNPVFLWGDGTLGPDYVVTAGGTYTVGVVDQSTGCTATTTVDIQENTTPPNAQINPGTPSINCDDNGPIELTATGGGGGPGGGNYAWSTGENDNDIFVNPIVNTTYTVTVTGNNGCTATTQVLVTVDLTPVTATITAPQTAVTCADLTAALTASGAGVGGDYQWSNNIFTAVNNVTPTATTTYTVTVSGSNGCTDTATVTITADVTPPTVNIGNPANTLDCNTPGPINLTASGSGTSYVWSNGGTAATTSVNPTATTTYTVTATAANGCTATDVQSVQVDLAEPTISITPASISCNNPGPVSITASGGVSYEWETGETTATVSVNPAATTTYTVSATGANGCTASQAVAVGVNTTPPAVTATADPAGIQPGQTTTLTATIIPGAAYAWSPSASLSDANVAIPIASPITETTYIVTVTDAGGCTATAAVTVAMLDELCSNPNVWIPNSFSPNGDGENDIFNVRGKNLTEVELLVVNRWGEVVYQEKATNPAGGAILLGWNGKFDGTDVAPDVYGYLLRVICTNEEEFIDRGNVTIIR
jgi:gliding motility-associated-like protein